MNVVSLITARGGSKSIPRKNIKPIAGKPLIAWTIQAARQCALVSRLIVSTEDEEIANVAREWGADVPFMRPAELARDDSTSLSAVEHALNWLETHDHSLPDYVLLLQPTSPLRTTQDIDAAIRLARERDAVAVVSVCEAATHPFICQQILEDGTLADFVTADLSFRRRQDLPPAFALNGAIYLNRADSLRRDKTFLPNRTLAYVMPPERSFDIDTSWDWHVAELILKDRNGHP